MKKIIIIYHKDCPDGFSSAWAAWRKFKNKAEYIAVDPKHLPEKLPKNKLVFAIDTSFSPKNLNKLIDRGNNVTVIDHHPSEENDVKLSPKFVFDLKHSGAVLAWNFFHPQKKMPILLKTIEDLDLWRFKMPNTKEISTYIEMLDFDFSTWDKLARDIENPKRQKLIIQEGTVILKYKEKITLNIVKRAQLVMFEGIKTYASNSVVLRSETGNILAKKILPPMSIVWSVKKDGRTWIGLYSDGSVDISKIAKKYGGGGHKAAAGFVLPEGAKLPWQQIN